MSALDRLVLRVERAIDADPDRYTPLDDWPPGSDPARKPDVYEVRDLVNATFVSAGPATFVRRAEIAVEAGIQDMPLYLDNEEITPTNALRTAIEWKVLELLCEKRSWSLGAFETW